MTPRDRWILAVIIMTIIALVVLLQRVGYAQGVSYPDPTLSDVSYPVIPATDCAGGCYRLTSVNIVPDVGVHVRGTVSGGPASTWTMGWPGTTVTIHNGSDFVMSRGACFTFPEHDGGPHFAYAGTNPAKSDRLSKIGMPVCQHREFYLTWTWSADGSAPTPPPTPPGANQWGIRTTATYPNCGLTRIMGTVTNTAGQPVPGVRVDVSWDGGVNATTTSGNHPGDGLGPSGWEFFLNDKPVAHTWHVRLATSSGAGITGWLPVWTDGHCGQGAVNVRVVDIYAIASGATPTVPPAPASPTIPAPTPPPTATALPMPTPGPGGPGGKAIYTGFPDNVTLQFVCSEGRPIAVGVPVGAPIPQAYELRCEIP